MKGYGSFEKLRISLKDPAKGIEAAQGFVRLLLLGQITWDEIIYALEFGYGISDEAAQILHKELKVARRGKLKKEKSFWLKKLEEKGIDPNSKVGRMIYVESKEFWDEFYRWEKEEEEKEKIQAAANLIDTNLPTWGRLGWEQEYMDAVARNQEKALELWWKGPPSNSDDVESWASSHDMHAMCIFAMGWMGYVMPDEPLSNWRNVGRKLVSAAIYYFFGPWREKFKFLLIEYDRKGARAKLPWIDLYRSSTAVAASLDDWESVDQLIRWPGPDLPDEEGVDDRTTEDNAYLIWLASRLRGEPESASAVQRKVVESGTRRRPKMLLAGADALLTGKADELSSALQTYLRHYLKRELELNNPSNGVCLEATFLWHLGRRRGMSLEPLPNELNLLIAKP